MNPVVVRPWAGTVARLLLGGVWIWAALSKLGNPRESVQAVRAYDATPEWLSKALGYGLPVLELSLGVLLVVGLVVRVSAAVSVMLFVVFLIGLGQAAARGIQIECGCFGGGGTTTSTSYTLDILRDIALLAVAGYLVVWPLTRLSMEEFQSRHDHVAMPSAKRMRTPEGRRRYESQVAAARAKAKDRDRYTTGLTAIVVVMISVIGIGVQAGRAKVDNVVPGTRAAVDNGIVFGKSAAATVDIYEDFGCPVCLQFEQATHVQLEKDVRANLAQVRYHPIAILDRTSPNQYSTRAANAAVCVSDAGTEPFVKYHDLLYGTSSGQQVQPKEGSAGPGDARLTSLASGVGLTTAQNQTLNTCILGQTYAPLVTAATDKSSQRGVSGTPTVFVNGTPLDGSSANALFSAIAKANAGRTPHPSVTPSPTPTVSPTPTSSLATPTTTSSAATPPPSPSASASTTRRATPSPSK